MGTVVNGGGLERITIHIDAVGRPTELLDYYRTSLLADDLYEYHSSRPALDGFSHDDEAYQVRSQFCRGENGPALFVTATRQGDSLSSLRIGIYTDERTSPCRRQERPGPPPSPIPPLPPPAGARFVMGAGPSGSRGPDSAHSGAVIETELDLAAVTAHYTRHLEAGGWAEQDSGLSDLSTWSTWTFRHERGESWRGLFVVFQRPDIPHRYILEAWAEWEGEA